MLEVLAKLQSTRSSVTPGDAPFRPCACRRARQDVLGPLLTKRAWRRRATTCRRWGVSSPDGVLVEVFDHHGDFSVRTVGFEGFAALGACFGNVMTMLSPLCELRGNFQWAQTAVHEYAHVVTLTLSHQRIPRWLTEGLSVQEEKKANPAWARPLERDVLDARANGQLPPVERLDESFRDGETIMLGYYQGSLLAEVIERDFGFQALHDLVAAFADGLDTPAAIRRVLKVEPADIDRRLLDYVDHVVGARAVIRPHRDEHGEALARQRAQGGDVDAWLDVAQACLDLQRRADADAALDHYLTKAGETPLEASPVATCSMATAQSARRPPAALGQDGPNPTPTACASSRSCSSRRGDKGSGSPRSSRRRRCSRRRGAGSASRACLAARRRGPRRRGRGRAHRVIAAHDSTALDPRLALAARCKPASRPRAALVRRGGRSIPIGPTCGSSNSGRALARRGPRGSRARSSGS